MTKEEKGGLSDMQRGKKAAAMLFVKAKIASVYGVVMSKSAAEFLEKNNTPFSYKELTGKIINRRGDGVCPMEQTVENIDDCDAAYNALREKMKIIKK